MKKIVMILLLCAQCAFAGIWVTPEFVGNGANDSVMVTFCTFDTTFYPKIADADSIIALRYGPNNSLVDSLTQSSSSIHRVRKGWYEIHYRGSGATGSMGSYRVHVGVKIGGDWRGAATASYRVIDDEVGNYFAKLSADCDSLKDTLGVLMHRADYVSSTGTGAYACTLFVFDSGSGSPAQGVFLRVLTSDDMATAAIGESNSNGRVIFSLDATEYHLLPYLTGYDFGGLPKSIAVTSAGACDTIWCGRYDPGAPPEASLCRVYGYVQSLGGEGLDGVVVTARIQKAPLIHDGVVISPYEIATSTDSAGYWQLDLMPNSGLEPNNTKYDFTIYYPSGTVARKQVVVPDSVGYWFRW